MSLQSVPAVVLASIVIFIGAHNLSVFFRTPRHHEHLIFFFTCLAIGFYDICCAVLYSASSWRDGAPWQAMQVVATALLCAVMPWFLFDFYADVLQVSRTAKTITAALSGFFVLAGTASIVNPAGLFWPGVVPLVKTIRLPLGMSVVYNEVRLGPLADLINLLAVLLVITLAAVIFRAFFRARRKGIVALVAVVMMILLCLLSDTLVARGALRFVYTSEYGLMGLAMLIAQSLSRKVVDAGRAQETLRASEARSEERLRQAQKMEAIGTLAGGIAHDFNNLLTGILGHSSLLLHELTAGSPLASDVRSIVSSAERASELARQILTFSRQDPRIEMRPVNPNTVVAEVVRLLERTVDKSVSIETRLCPAPLRIRANAGQVHQAILNLGINGAEAMPRGGRLVIETSREEAGAVITVADTGIGIGKDVQPRIFDPFFTTKEQGRGLGLPMVYGIVRGHGGDITVRSEPGKGTTFRICVPVTDEEDAVVARSPEPPRGGQETVLVIDDEPFVRRVLTRILERAGYAVLEAEDGPTGLAAFEGSRGAVDLVVLDVSMPGMGGAEVYERLVALDPQVKVLLSSGYSENERISSILARGVRTFLVKPYKVETALRAVREALDG